jgi:hypothetical protein
MWRNLLILRSDSHYQMFIFSAIFAPYNMDAISFWIFQQLSATSVTLAEMNNVIRAPVLFFCTTLNINMPAVDFTFWQNIFCPIWSTKSGSCTFFLAYVPQRSIRKVETIRSENLSDVVDGTTHGFYPSRQMLCDISKRQYCCIIYNNNVLKCER